jgi:hypothetical protein
VPLLAQVERLVSLALLALREQLALLQLLALLRRQAPQVLLVSLPRQVRLQLLELKQQWWQVRLQARRLHPVLHCMRLGKLRRKRDQIQGRIEVFCAWSFS